MTKYLFAWSLCCVLVCVSKSQTFDDETYLLQTQRTLNLGGERSSVLASREDDETATQGKLLSAVPPPAVPHPAAKEDPCIWMMGTFIKILMPGKLPNLNRRWLEVTFMLISLAWIAIYKKLFHLDDMKAANGCPWNDTNEGRVFEDPDGVTLLKPDLILVFPHPSLGEGKDTMVDQDVLQTALAMRTEGRETISIFPRTEKLIQSCSEGFSLEQAATDAAAVAAITVAAAKSMAANTAAAAGQAAGSVTSLVTTPFGEGDGKEPADDKEPTLREAAEAPLAAKPGISLWDVQQAMLQDLFMQLPEKGFDVQMITSVDDQQLILLIALKSERHIIHLLKSHGIKLQIQLPVIRDTLGIDQPPGEDESSPPYVLYDALSCTNLLGEGKTDLDLWQVFNKGRKGPDDPGNILTGAQRVQVAGDYLTEFLNFDYAVEQGILDSWFPAHNGQEMARLRAFWSKWSLLKDLYFGQPLTHIHDYFGSRVAFLFAWNGFYCKALLALTPAALVFHFANIAAAWKGPNLYWDSGSCFGFSILLAIWAKLAANWWAEEQEYLVSFWDSQAHKGKDHKQRADFQGEVRQSQVDRNVTELYDTGWKRTKCAVSWFITFLFCCIVLLGTFALMNVYQGHLTSMASTVQGIVMFVLQTTYVSLAMTLTLWENHQYEDLFYKSYLQKVFLFSAVNQYFPFFYVVVVQSHTKIGCQGSCLEMLQNQLPVTLLTLAFMNIVQTMLARVQIMLALWWESRQVEFAGGETPEFTYVEAQTKFGDFRFREQIDNMSQLSLTLGFVFIFGAVSPVIVPACLLVFMVQLRASAIQISCAAKRTIPREVDGIGAWEGIINTLVTIGMVFSGYLLVEYGAVFKGTQVLTKVTGMGLYGLFLVSCRSLVDLWAPVHSEKRDLLTARRQCVTMSLLRKSEAALCGRLGVAENLIEPTEDAPTEELLEDAPTVNPSHTAKNQQRQNLVSLYKTTSKLVESGDWAAIPKAIIPKAASHD